MISHDPVRIRLREALEHSAAGKFLRGARTRWADAWAHARLPSKSDIRALEQQGNECDAWPTVRLLGTGSLASIRNCRFEGYNVLRLGDKPGRGPVLRDSVIRDCLLGVCTVERVTLLERMMIDHGAVLRHVGSCVGKSDSCFCLGLALHPGSEAGVRRVFLADSLLLEDYAAMAALASGEQEALAHEWASRLKPCVTDYAFVGAGARIEYTRFVEDSYVGAGAVIRGATAVRRCVLAASEADDGKNGNGKASAGTKGVKETTSAGAEKRPPCEDDDLVRIGDDVIVEDCVLQPGVRLDSAAQARRSLFLEHSGAEQGGHVADAVIGPNNHIAKGEVTASLVGPFVGFHHQALLIGALWPEGRGNVGYGANVGSNHTGRKPDQELRPGEGTFFGLSCAIKYPADFSSAPYSLFATGVTTPPQKIAFPFSLIAPGGPHTSPPGTPPEKAGLNEIIPGWMWGENAYALIRNAYKYADRNKAKRHPLPALAPPEGSPLAGTFLAADVFAPRIAGFVRRALAQLDDLPGAAAAGGLLTERELPSLGKNALLSRRVKTAREAYRHYLLFVFCRALLWAPSPSVTDEDKKALAQAARDAALTPGDSKGIAGMFRGLLDAVTASLRRDAERGLKVFADYASFHPEAEQDAVIMRLKAELAALEPVLRERLKSVV